jgi:uncharacterized membrane protein SpoIIM required for sporulation
MIIDLPRFIARERIAWTELEHQLDELDRDPARRLTFEELTRFHYLYQKVSADLAQLATFSSEPDLRRYLESLTSRAYAEIQETRDRGQTFKPLQFFTHTFPLVFQRHVRLFWFATLAMLVGSLFGAGLVTIDPTTKETLLPFEHLHGSPADRVAREEQAKEDQLSGARATFSSALMTNNIRVSILMLATGIAWGVGTLILLFYNGVILGAVALDYITAGQTTFLLGWLLPHGVVEIPAVLIAGQAGLLLGRTVLVRNSRLSLRLRLRAIAPDLVTLIFGVAMLLVWAGIVESFLSQYHEPVVPYWAKIAFGMVELIALAAFLGRKLSPATPAAPDRSWQISR